MRNRTIALGLGLALSMGAAGVASAQAAGDAAKRGKAAGAMQQGANRHHEQLFKGITLSAAQQAQLEAIRKERGAQMKAARSQGQRGDARGQRSWGQAQRGEARAQRGEGQAQRGEARAQRGEGQAQRGEARAQRGEGQAQRGEARAQRGNRDVRPGIDSAQRVQARAEMQRRSDQHFASIRAILTPDQQRQFDANVAELRQRGGKRG
jgi:Spy/CpxP family protein refolding chaperone